MNDGSATVRVPAAVFGAPHTKRPLTSVRVVTDGAPATVDVSPGEEQVVLLNNSYVARTGPLVVLKETRGEAASFRAAIRINVLCDDSTEVSRVYPAGSRLVPLVVLGLVAGTTCTISEVDDGSSAVIEAATEPPSPQDVTIQDGVLTVARVVNTYTAERRSLTVVKEMTGAGASLQGTVEISVKCLSVVGSFTVPAGTTSSTSIVLDDLYPGESCTVTETSDGSLPGVVSATTSFDPGPTITIGPAEHHTVVVTDDFTPLGTVDPDTGGRLPSTVSWSGPIVMAGLALLGGGLAVLTIRRRSSSAPRT